MISQLPRWVEFGAFLLALVAGFVNAVGLLSFEHQSVSHLSGTATLLGAGFLNLPWLNTLHLAGILLCFLLGSVTAGFLLHGPTLKLGKHYDTALFLESALLLLTLWFMSQGSIYGHLVASAACGLQNALATTYSNAVIRTTHVTGIFTDLGIMFGEYLRGNSIDKRKAILFITIICGFIVGGTVGAFLYGQYNFIALLFPAGLCFYLAVVYRVYSKKYSNR
ncbi:hypothetical protein PULV_b0446 [Pseudoalteromonas ulvae UL12]|uniref:YoaK family protein n=1 Tax=Pseudoalteromonas ulvae TaxID=107327 RepID=UPI00186B8502|nr:YoaK family protein [Pseudoalteromonas ulvae]MBE0365785.1 hypothetical protein [Pseudoalteromonas ulvae UL12]